MVENLTKGSHMSVSRWLASVPLLCLALACGGGGTCFLALHVNAAWQAEFTAGLLVRLR